MKKNRNSIASRMLRLENLESREMLSVAPAGLAAASMFLDAGNVVDEPIDLGLSDVDEEASASTFIVSDYDEGTRVATVSWDAFEGAESYAVQISRDGGETWLEYSSDLVETSEEITGITVGKSYAFQAIGFDAEGAVVAERQVSFAPISMSCSNDAFMFGETITVEVAGAENATYDINTILTGITSSTARTSRSRRRSTTYPLNRRKGRTSWSSRPAQAIRQAPARRREYLTLSSMLLQS